MSHALQEIAPGLHIRQYRRARFERIVSPLPGVIRIEAGEKRLSAGTDICSAPAGSFALLADHTPLTIENLPPSGDPYAATALAFPRSIFDAACHRLDEHAVGNGASVSASLATPELSRAFDAVLSAFERHETGPRLDLLCEALALELSLAGLSLPPARQPGFSDTLRGLLASEIARSWTAESAARAIGVSPATLRRRLKAEGTAFNEILRELRLASGLHLLQTTRWPVASVATAVGYASPSRFSQRFRQRFGCAPGDLRKPLTTIDRSLR